MQSFHFGPAARPIHGAWHPAQGQRRGLGVLLLPSFGQEVNRSYRLLRVLADRLSLQGVDAMRIDWRGSGDSWGDDEDAGLALWREDAGLAHAELRARAQPQRLIWLGTRLGATVALQAATGLADALVLLEPVLDGAALLARWHEAHLALLDQAYPITNAWRQRVMQAAHALAAVPTEAMGFGLSPAFVAELRALRPEALPLPAGLGATVLAHGEPPGLAAWLAAQPAGAVAHRALPLTLPWFSAEGGGVPLVPPPMLRALLEACAP